TVISTANGKFCCPPQIAAILFDKFKDLARKAKENCLSAPDTQLVSVSQGLTRREKQILGLMTNGLSNKEIAKALVIEVSTVKNHVHNILVKLEVHNRIQAVALLKREEQLNSIGTIDALRAGEAYC
ncbi:MAG: response regulator transcription factor, partial [Desulfobacterales bacterium]|nr:response regulator transcription factor [Desulfobacterales bacterium]